MGARKTVVAYVEFGELLLVVWNKRFGGWALPGGMVEEGESLEAALARELYEETRLTVFQCSALYDAPVGELAARFQTPDDRLGTHAHVFRVLTHHDAYREGERGCPCTLFTREEFLRWSPFAPFYHKMFAILAASGGLGRVAPPPRETAP